MLSCGRLCSDPLTLVHSSRCVAMLLDGGDSIKTSSSILLYSDLAGVVSSNFKHQPQRSLRSQLRPNKLQGHPEFEIKEGQFLRIDKQGSIMRKHLHKSHKKHDKKVSRTIRNCALRKPRNARKKFSRIFMYCSLLSSTIFAIVTTYHRNRI